MFLFLLTRFRTLDIEFNSTQLGPVSANARLNPAQSRLAIQMVLEATQYVIDAIQQRVLFLGGNVDQAEIIPLKFTSKTTQELVLAYNKVSRSICICSLSFLLDYPGFRLQNSIYPQRK